MEIPRNWRLRKVRYGLIGEVCPGCDVKIFPPRDICPSCGNNTKEVVIYPSSNQQPTGSVIIQHN